MLLVVVVVIRITVNYTHKCMVSITVKGSERIVVKGGEHYN